MKVYIGIHDFGSDDQKRNLCASILAITGMPADVNDAGIVVVTCEASEIGDLFAKLSQDGATNWIEYTVQFDA